MSERRTWKIVGAKAAETIGSADSPDISTAATQTRSLPPRLGPTLTVAKRHRSKGESVAGVQRRPLSRHSARPRKRCRERSGRHVCRGIASSVDKGAAKSRLTAERWLLTLCREGTAAKPWEGSRQGVNARATQHEVREAATCPHLINAEATDAGSVATNARTCSGHRRRRRCPGRPDGPGPG